MVMSGFGFIPAVLTSLVIGGLFGLFNGLCITKLHLQAFIVTLASMNIARGLARFWANGIGIPPVSYTHLDVYKRQLVNMVMSVDPECNPEIPAMLGSSIATCISDIPFDGPCATTQVGLIDGEFVINPSLAQKEISDLQLTVASTREKVIMIEAGANEVPEDKMIEAIYKAHEVNQEIIRFIDKIVAECGKEKHLYASCAVPEELFAAIREIVPPEEMEEAVFTDDKQTREENIREITARLQDKFADNEEWLNVLGEAVYQYQKKTVRKICLLYTSYRTRRSTPAV